MNRSSTKFSDRLWSTSGLSTACSFIQLLTVRLIIFFISKYEQIIRYMYWSKIRNMYSYFNFKANLENKNDFKNRKSHNLLSL